MGKPHQQLCAITTETVYLNVLATDGRLWGELAASDVFFHRKMVPMDQAIRTNERDGIASYLDRVH